MPLELHMFPYFLCYLLIISFVQRCFILIKLICTVNTNKTLFRTKDIHSCQLLTKYINLSFQNLINSKVVSVNSQLIEKPSITIFSGMQFLKIVDLGSFSFKYLFLQNRHIFT